jgi:hypothetical protein
MMRDTTQAPRLLGYVQLRVGQKVYALPVQAARFDRDDAKTQPGGFFIEGEIEGQGGQLGILVDSEATAGEVREQIALGSAEAVRHISKRFLN